MTTPKLLRERKRGKGQINNEIGKQSEGRREEKKNEKVMVAADKDQVCNG